MLATGKTFQQERYRIVHQFEYSGKNTVYEAYDSILRANVVLKEFVGGSKIVSPAQQQGRRSAFVEKAKVLTGIGHEALPRVHDYFSEADQYYLVMELVDGNDLRTLLETRKEPFALMEAANWAEQILDALSCLHRNVPPVIHGDVKPQNIRLTGEGKIKLMAIGNAEVYNSKANAANSVRISDTTAIPYLPLEQIWQGLDPASQKVILHSYDDRSEKILEQAPDSRSDIYALGATFYHLLTGQIPADALARSIDIMDGNADPLLPPNQINPLIPAEISDVLMRAMEIKRESRFDSAIIMRQVLRTALVRAREIQAEKIRQKNEAVAEDLKIVERNRLEQEKRIVEQKRLELESEQKKLEEERRLIRQQTLALESEKKKQAEILNQQLREAEAQQILVRERAAEEERQKVDQQNRENETAVLTPDKVVSEFTDGRLSETDNETLPPLTDSFSKADFQETFSAETLHEAREIFDSSKNQPHEFGELFAEQAPNNQIIKRMSAAAGALIVLGGAFFGIWFAVTTKTAAGSPASPPAMSLSEAANPAPVESTPAPSIKAPAETTPENTTAPEITETHSVLPVVKNKIASTNPAEPAAPRIQKPTAPAIKPAAAPPSQKKNVTVDDIINDN